MSSEHAGDAPLAEAELKIRLSAEDFTRLPAMLAVCGFTRKGEEALTDTYLAYHRARRGGYDFFRLREQGGAFRLTRKQWTSDARGHAVRTEDERDLTAAEAERLRAASPEAPVLHKRRTDFHGTIGGQPAVVSLDALDLGGATHYFLEAERRVPVAQAEAARARIRAWLRDLLGRDVEEASSMLELLLAAQ